MTSDASRQTYPFKLLPLPYAYEALEPHIDRQTMQLHHDKHHQTYVTKLNEAIATQPTLQSLTLVELLREPAQLPESVRGAVRNNGGGHLNHDFFWNIMKPGGGGQPDGALGAAIASSFGSFAEFRKRFSDAAAKHFASGWVALALTPHTNALEIVDLKDHETLEPRGQVGVLIIDVWEHAYYVKYQNRRPEFIEAFWNVVDWRRAADRFDQRSGTP